MDLKYENKNKGENQEFELSVTSFDYLNISMANCSKIKSIQLFFNSHKDLQNKSTFRMWTKKFDNDTIKIENRVYS